MRQKKKDNRKEKREKKKERGEKGGAVYVLTEAMCVFMCTVLDQKQIATQNKSLLVLCARMMVLYL